ncbi:MAG: B12-binding domain-containing radical SAM protein [Tannerella sp.]|jgi:radical SAM superfamily enzyme YgiQ (UPF0313 family)|nr:B12-binding domain-containing radical SAM protein [Tannerella sp.]
MRVLLTTINAKFIHTSLALRLLYVATKERFDVSFSEYTLKEDVDNIADNILSAGYDVIGLGVYIWNVKQIRELVNMLKERQPALTIILGGPEVTYEPEFFLNQWPVDYVISGEGEFVLGELLDVIQRKHIIDIEGVSSRTNISKTVVRANVDFISLLPSPYQLSEDREQMKNKVVYVETSRGCPYTCSYCLASLEKGVRYFPHTYLFENLEYLIKNGARQIKFLDRTFNLNQAHTKAIFDFLIRCYRPNLSCQFEIYADLLRDEMIDYLNATLPPHYFRFEIGIQTTCEAANQAVGRKQDFRLIAGNIRKLMDGGKVDLHLDLIAGLPHESFERFIRSFNDVFALRAKEVQLGFLKMLRGTELRQNATLYEYMYDPDAPYEVHSHVDMTEAALQRIRRVEHTLDTYWNSGRFTRTMQHIFDFCYMERYFEFFDGLATHIYENQEPKKCFQLEDTFRQLDDFLQSNGFDLSPTLRTDYYHCFSQRPPGFRPNPLDKKTRKRLLYEIGSDKTFLARHHLTRRMVEKRTVIDPISANLFLLTIFPEDNQGIITLEYKIEKPSM